MKIRPAGAGLLHANGRTDTTNLTVAFRNLAKAPKNAWLEIYHDTNNVSVIRNWSGAHITNIQFRTTGHTGLFK
jgi:hypothetical protein